MRVFPKKNTNSIFQTSVASDGQDDGPSPAKKPKQEEETKMVKNTMEFVSLEKALAADWSKVTKSRFRRMDASAFFLLMTLFEFQSRERMFTASGAQGN